MANIIFSHGGKGGTGKSVASASIIDYCLANDRSVILIEGDVESPDVVLRFKNHVPYAGVDLIRSGKREQSAVPTEILNNVDHLGAKEDTIVVVNMPGNASATMDKFAEVMVTGMAGYGHDCSVIYSLGEHQTATDSIRYSVESGLLSILPTSKVTIVYNEILGDPKNWNYVTSGAREEFGTDFNEIVIPEVVPPELAHKVFETKRPFHELIKPDSEELTIIERVMFDKKWVQPVHELIPSILPSTTSPESSGIDYGYKHGDE